LIIYVISMSHHTPSFSEKLTNGPKQSNKNRGLLL
jgi:hypothetical protein